MTPSNQHHEPDESVAYANTDRELWREGDPEDAMSYYAPSIHVTEQGGIGINVGGTVYVKTLREWHGLVEQLEAMQRQRDEADQLRMDAVGTIPHGVWNALPRATRLRLTAVLAPVSIPASTPDARKDNEDA